MRAIKTQDNMLRCNTAAVMARVSVTAISSHLSRVTARYKCVMLCHVMSTHHRWRRVWPRYTCHRTWRRLASSLEHPFPVGYNKVQGK